jgi:ABC-type Na+ efflux pump permease subunit
LAFSAGDENQFVPVIRRNGDHLKTATALVGRGVVEFQKVAGRKTDGDGVVVISRGFNNTVEP